MEERIKKKIFELADCIVNNSKGEIRIVFNEDNDTKQEDKESGHCIKYKEKRLGRDLELYAFMAEVMGEQQMLTHLLTEIIFGIKDVKPSYLAALEYMKLWGIEIYPENLHEEWIDICKG